MITFVMTSGWRMIFHTHSTVDLGDATIICHPLGFPSNCQVISHIFSPFLYQEKWTSKRPPLTSWTWIGNSLPNPTKGYGLVARSGYHTQTRVQTFSPLPVSWVYFYCSTKGAYSTKSRRNRSIHEFTHLKLKNMLDDFPTKPLSRTVSQGALWLFFLFAKETTMSPAKAENYGANC